MLAPGTYQTMLVREDGSVWSSGVTSKDRSTTFVQVIASDATYAAAGE